MPCCRLATVLSPSPSNKAIVFESTYSLISISFSEYFDKKQNLWEPESYFSWRNRSSCKRKWSICDQFSHANINCPFMSKNNEKWSSSIKNSGNFHYSKDTLWWKRTQLYLCNCWEIFRSVHSTQQYAQIIDRQQQRRPSIIQTYYEML